MQNAKLKIAGVLRLAFSTVALLAAVVAKAQPWQPVQVIFPAAPFTGSMTNSVVLNVQPVPALNPQTDGSFLYGGAGTEFTCVGTVTNPFVPGFYLLSSPGWGRSLEFQVLETNTPQNVIGLIGTNIPTFVPTPFLTGNLSQWVQLPTNTFVPATLYYLTALTNGANALLAGAGGNRDASGLTNVPINQTYGTLVTNMPAPTGSTNFLATTAGGQQVAVPFGALPSGGGGGNGTATNLAPPYYIANSQMGLTNWTYTNGSGLFSEVESPGGFVPYEQLSSTGVTFTNVTGLYAPNGDVVAEAIFGSGSGLTDLPSQWAFNMLDYGFVPNNAGAGAVNDFAWTNLCNLATNAAGLNVYVPGYGAGGGTFWFNHSLNIPLDSWGGSPRTSMRLFGDGSPTAPLSIFQIDPPNGSLGDIVSTNQGGLEIDHISIVGANSTVPNIFDSATVPYFHDVLFNDNGGTNIALGNITYNFGGYGGKVIDCRQGLLASDACFVWGGPQVNTTLFEGNSLMGGAGYTEFYFQGPYDNDNAFWRNYFELGNWTNAITLLNQSCFNSIIGNDFDDLSLHTQEGVLIGSDCSWNQTFCNRWPQVGLGIVSLSSQNTIVEAGYVLFGGANVYASSFNGAFAGDGAAVTDLQATNMVVRSPLMPAQAQAMQLWPGVTPRSVIETNASFTVSAFVPMGNLSSGQWDIPNTNLTTTLTVTISASFTPYPVATNSLVIAPGQTGFIYADYDGVSTNMGAGL